MPGGWDVQGRGGSGLLLLLLLLLSAQSALSPDMI